MILRAVPLAFALSFSACRSDPEGTTKVDPGSEAGAAPVVAAEAKAPAADPEPRVRGPKAKPKGGTVTYAEALAKSDEGVEYTLARAAKQGNSWMLVENVAQAYLQRARLTGDYDDYANAEREVERAFTINPGFGPYLTRARLNYTLHRLPAVDADLTHVREKLFRTLGPEGWSGLFVFEGEVAFQRGQYDAARDKFDEAEKLTPGSTDIALARANLLWKTGDIAGAEKLMLEAEGKYHGRDAEPKAWYRLMLGLMDLDRGRWDEALVHYREAEQKLSGWWLVDEHIAEITRLLGRRDEAKTLYLDIVARTGNPEFMDALAEIAQEEGDEVAAKEWIGKADAAFAAQLARYPEAAYGHALGHYLAFGDAVETLALADKNVALRPNGEAQTLLAQAQLKAGNTAAARKTIDAVLATAWRTAETWHTAHEVYVAAKDPEAADKAKREALAIDPHAFD
jgi:tetratricopeptide (TPR) repeat protein